jgi:hypothetical protein
MILPELIKDQHSKNLVLLAKDGCAVENIYTCMQCMVRTSGDIFRMCLKGRLAVKQEFQRKIEVQIWIRRRFYI